jgi:hypothetical protein
MLAMRLFVGLLLVGLPALGSAFERQLAFDVSEGRNLNSLLRADQVAAHLVLRSGLDPRIVVAFPAGNSGVGLWFTHLDRPVTWTLLERPRPVVERDPKGRPLYGIVAVAAVSAAPGELVIKQAILSSVRVLRDYQAQGTVPSEVAAAAPSAQGATLTWARDRLDGAAGYRLNVMVTRGSLEAGHIKAGRDGRIELRITALSGETPLIPLAEAELLDPRAAADRSARNTLSFLSYREKFLAGSWRFDTYFGRDTLMSVTLLMPALSPDAVEAALSSVLARLSPRGEVAHEEDIGEFAILDHLRAEGSKSAAPTFNYNMIDGNFMLAPVVRAWLADDPRGRARAAAFLARHDGRDEESARTAGSDLVANLRFVVQSAVAFGEDPRASHLIALKGGMDAGEWRDSRDGLGGGRVPYDVNAVLVPAALEATATLYGSGVLDPYLAGEPDRRLFERAAALAKVWNARAAQLFEVIEPNAAAREAIKAYARQLGIAANAAEAAIGTTPVRFHALALNSDGTPVRVMHSDEGFALLFTRPRPQDLEKDLNAIMRPFPAGLLTGAGMLVANPVFAARDIQARFTNRAYHGTVVWSWQQAMMAAALDRQLRRRDLAGPVVKDVKDAQRQLWRAIAAGAAVRSSELWSWSYAGDQFRIVPFGANAADADESNAAQLWSTVYLAIRPPLRVR